MMERRLDSYPDHGPTSPHVKMEAVGLLLVESERRWARGLESHERDDVRAGITLAEAAAILLADVKLEVSLAATA
jgi:hypothetical protein